MVSELKSPEQCFVVLRALVEHQGELVSREDLRKAVWPSDTFVDFDLGLNKIVKAAAADSGRFCRHAFVHRDGAQIGVPICCARESKRPRAQCDRRVGGLGGG